MQKRSSSMQKAIFLDKKKVIRKLSQLAMKAKTTNSNIMKIVLFGSLVNNTYTGTSDADLLIVLKKSNLRFLDRIPEFAFLFLDAPVAIDIFPYTESEIHRVPLAAKALSGGVTLC
jgi:predicted nucleotidyltransferase